MALHVVQGGVRLAMVAMLAMTAAQVVSAVIRSAGAEPLGFPVLTLYSLALGMTLVASHHSSPLTAFPVAFIGSAVLILLVVLSVARDRDMHVRRLSWLETVAMALLGAAAAMTYDLVYVAPPLAAGFILVRVVAAGHRPGFVLRTAALRRWLVLSVGFLAVFVPARLVIAGRCRNLECYSGSGVSFSPDVPGLTARRILTGAPPAGWSHTADRVRPYGFDVGVIDLASNWLLVVLLVAMTVVAGRAAVSTARSTAAVGSSQSGWLRLAASLGAFGAFTAVLPSLLVSLSAYIQWARPAVGEAWRDTLMVQVGWSFMITAVVVAGIAVAGSRRHKAVATALAATALCAGLAMTLFNNERMAHIGRGTPTSALVREISTAVIRIDLTDDGNTRRCNMIDAYTELLPPARNNGGGDPNFDRRSTISCSIVTTVPSVTDQKRRNLAARRPASQKQFLHRVDRHGGGTNAGQRGTQRLVRHTCWEMTQVASDQRIPSLPGCQGRATVVFSIAGSARH